MLPFVYLAIGFLDLPCTSVQSAFAASDCCGTPSKSVDVSAFVPDVCTGSPHNVWSFDCTHADGMSAYCRTFLSKHAEYMRTTNHVRSGVGNADATTGPLRSVLGTYFVIESNASDVTTFTVVQTFADEASEAAHVAMSQATPLGIGPRPACPNTPLLTGYTEAGAPIYANFATSEATDVFSMVIGLLFAPAQGIAPNPACGINVKGYINGGRITQGFRCADGVYA
jgi:hypothetical protein